MTNNPLVEALREKIAAARKTADDIRYYSGGSQRNYHAEELAEYLMNCAGDDLLAALASSAPATGEREQIVAWLLAEAVLCDCHAREADDCVCGAWNDNKQVNPVQIAEAIARGDHRTQSGEMEGGDE